MAENGATLPPMEEPDESVPEGMVVDFLTGKFVKDTPEEYVRQNLEKALVRQYHYPASEARPEFPIKVGSSRKRVDIVVFAPGAEHKQEHAYILVETKKASVSSANRKEGVEQLKSYMAACLNADYGLWTNGDERFCFAKRQQGQKHYFEDIVDIPAAGKTEEDAERPTRKDLRPATAHNLLFAFRRTHNYIAAREGMQKPAAFWELLKLIFCKIEDERSKDLSFYVTPQELTNNTSAGAAKARIQRLFTDKVVKKYPTIFASPETQTIQLKASVVAYVVSQLQGFSLLNSPVDVKGVAYEEIVGSNLRGDRGEFFTPRNACRMAVAMVDPRPGETLLDPACGTGGFLIIAMNHALIHIETRERASWLDSGSPSEEELQELFHARQEYVTQSVFGLDLNPDLVRAAKMNMVLNNDGSGNLYQADSLANPHTWTDVGGSLGFATVDVLFTNPPFGANILIDDEEVLSQYELGAVWDQQGDGTWAIRYDKQGRRALQKSQPPEVLFIERCVQFLRPGTGRMAMVIPNGILNNPAQAYVRQWMLSNTQILAVVDMARDLFQPKNDTQTSMALMRRLSEAEKRKAEKQKLTYPVFMAVAEKVGHDKRGNTLHRRTSTGADVLVTRLEAVPQLDPETGDEVVRELEVKELVIDDELPEVATAYREWLTAKK